MCKEGTCKCKEICAKMQEAGLRECIKSLKGSGESAPRTRIFQGLNDIENILTSYECLPMVCLFKRLDWVKSQLNPMKHRKLLSSGKSSLNQFIVEIEAFLDNQNA